MRYRDILKNTLYYKYGKNRPKLLIIAGQHGDEKEPVKYINTFNRYIKNKKINGSIIIIPIANIIAYNYGTRTVYDEDLNRGYGITEKKLSFITDKIKEVITKCDYVIDIHSTFPDSLKYQAVLIDKKQKTLPLAKVFNLPIIKYDCPENSLRHYCMNNNIPCITIELVEDSSYSKDNFEKTHMGMISFLKHINMI